jgi:anaerobilin synthase
MGENGSASSLEKLLHSKPGNSPRGVYLHVPFCDRICTFCNMNRKLAAMDGLQKYSAKLEKEFLDAGQTPYVQEKEFDVMYFGGGTPTVFPPAELENLLDTVTRNIPLSSSAEWTVETTLHNLSDEKIKMLARAGVNRLSVGIQTFSDRGRKLLGRTGNQESIVTRMEQVRRLFDGTLGIDIIYSYPGQTLQELDEDLLWTERLGIDGVSFYSLMIQEDSTLSRRIQEGSLMFERNIGGDLELHNRLYRGMLDHGFELLELTKMVKPGRDEYRYIKVRYSNGDILPLGTGAGGRIGNHQVYRMAPGRDMIAPVNTAFDGYNLLLGYLQYGLYDGEELSLRCPDCPPEYVLSLLKQYSAEGLLEKKAPDSWRLTPEGVFWGNNLAVDFMQKVIRKSGVIYETSNC